MWSYFSNFISLFYPNCCDGCGRTLIKREKHLCLYCSENLPRTNFHLYKDNPVEMLFAGRVPVFRATAFCFYKRKNIMQRLIHQLKYGENQEIGVCLGFLFGMELAITDDFKTVDIIIPIPLHRQKLQQRGYNQSECIGKGIGEGMLKPVNTSSMVRTKKTLTQTHKNKYERIKNVQNVFTLIEEDKLKGKHILLIDDVCTTGATMESATQLLLTLPDVKVSIACLACTDD